MTSASANRRVADLTHSACGRAAPPSGSLLRDRGRLLRLLVLSRARDSGRLFNNRFVARPLPIQIDSVQQDFGHGFS